jgi:hypothetical protein
MSFGFLRSVRVDHNRYSHIWKAEEMRSHLSLENIAGASEGKQWTEVS